MHITFFCCNQRPDGAACCEDYGATELRAYAKDKVNTPNLSSQSKVRINKAGCLDRCELGPVMVIYPQESCYTYVDKSDVDEIIEEHLKNSRIVDCLKI